MQNVSLSSEEPQLCHEVYNYSRYLFSYMAVQISKNKNAMIEGRKKGKVLPHSPSPNKLIALSPLKHAD